VEADKSREALKIGREKSHPPILLDQKKESSVSVPRDAWRRVIVESIDPSIDGGQFAIKRSLGEPIGIKASVFTDGHDELSGFLLYRKQGAESWTEVEMEPLGNDRWQSSFLPSEIGYYEYTIQAWIDPFKSWRRDLAKRLVAGQDLSVHLLVGSAIISKAAGHAKGSDRIQLQEWAKSLSTPVSQHSTVEAVKMLDSVLDEVMARYPDRSAATTYEPYLPLVVDPVNARFSSWYEMFPRSCGETSTQHGTFQDCERRLPYIASLGFDVLYLPPIHPIGITHRKGKNNSLIANPDDVGSPWAIGSSDGGHKSVHPQLGTIKDFKKLVAKAKEYGIDIALDIAFQCSPDHPYATDHKEWFQQRPDGSIQYAENPPKKYEDIYPFDFNTSEWESLWIELRSIFIFWIKNGVRIFRVDNPHTKPFPFWEWTISTIKKENPDVIFLAEAFTRPKVMYRLAKLGFTQSYTYFAWRNTKEDLIDYFTELTQTKVSEYFRPNLWPNTPDILTEFLQVGGRPAFMMRFTLAATLGASYGIYGPAFELCLSRPREHQSEEYLDSEKYEIKQWDLKHPDSLRHYIARMNQIRRDNTALQSNVRLQFHSVDNGQIVCYSKTTASLDNIILIVVNLDPHHTQTGWVTLTLESLGLEHSDSYQVYDLIGGATYLWQGQQNYIELNPHVCPAHVFRVHRRIRTERDFDYYL